MRNFSRSRSITNSSVCARKRLDRLERARHEVLANLPDVRVLDDQVAADRNERRVRLELGLDVRLRVIGVEDDEDRPIPCASTHLVDDVRIGGRAPAEVGDPRMRRIVLALGLDVDRHDLASPDEVAERREEERAAAAIRPGLDDELRPRLDHDLLVDPEVERVLQRLRAEPRRLGPGIRTRRGRRARARRPRGRADGRGESGAIVRARTRVVLHGQRF